jgi:type I restriction enzyme S subunit
MPRIGDVGFARMNGTQKVVLISEAELGSLFSTGFCFLEPNDALDSKYLFYFLTSEGFQSEKNALAGEGIMGGIKNSDVANMQIPLPPLPEQQRIVRLLDAAFEGIAIAKANAEKNLRSAHALFERHLQAVFSQDTDQWHVVPLADISSIEGGAAFPLRYQGLDAEQYPFYKVGDMNSTGNDRWLRHANHMISDATRRKLGAHLFRAGTVVFPKVGGAINTNKKRIASTDCCIDNNCFGVSPLKELVNGDLLYFWFRSIRLSDFANDAALPSITKTTLSSWPVAMPIQRHEQDRVVELLAQFESLSGMLIATAEKKLWLINQLSHTLLSQALNGDLRAD